MTSSFPPPCTAHGSWYLLQHCPPPFPQQPFETYISLVISMVSGHGSRHGEEAAEIMAHLCPDLLSQRGFSTPSVALQPAQCLPSNCSRGMSTERGGS